jgi:RNA polymerase sigma-70 factor (ECF subfamily)
MFSTNTMPDAWTQACMDVMASLQAQLPWRMQDAAAATALLPDDASTDEDCMSRYQKGDAQAFRILYLRYRQKLHRYVLRLAARPSEAEEVFQEVWVAVIRGREGYEPMAPFAAWLFSIAHRRAADRWRTLARHAPDWRSHPETDEPDLLGQHLEAIHATPERYVHNDALGKALLAAVQELPLPQREAFLMKAEGGLSLEDIAFATGVSRETVKSRLRYAQRRLREALEDWR